MIFDNISSNQKINKWINQSYQECKASYPLPEKGIIAFDIGANVGGFCIHAHKNFDKIFAFEPMIENYNILCQTIETLGIKNVEIYNTALYSESNKTLPLRVYSGSHTKDITCADFIDENIKEIDQQCETISLKDAMDALGLDQLDYLKLDCEGSEYAILENYNNFANIMCICMEIHQFYGYDRKKKLLKMLENFYYLTDVSKYGEFSVNDVIQNQIVDNFENLHNVLLINRNITQ
jgi:FkbM family methyltransferase